ncbi:hypothetical protein [Rhodoflexus caldus]|jgi:hypothetical protein|uniref:hypothetical protein n=1 Tax=Rhodoflexus caldus TaxID=2891236 RepID=UPI00202A4EF4|nr:hypothetical protein [Rhodoflexus caldus]
MKNIQQIILSLLFCVLAIYAYANSNSDSLKTTRTDYGGYKWDMGVMINAFGLIDYPSRQLLPTYQTLIRLNRQKYKDLNTVRHYAFRLRFEYFSSFTIRNIRSNNVYEYSVMPGIEWQQHWKRFQLHYGAEVGVFRFGSSFFDGSGLFHLGATAFIGAKYFLLPRLSISGETALMDYRYRNDLRNGRQAYFLTVRPVHSVGIHFHFD